MPFFAIGMLASSVPAALRASSEITSVVYFNALAASWPGGTPRVFHQRSCFTFSMSARRGPDDLFEKGVQVDGNSSGKIDVTLACDGAHLEGSVTDDDGAVIGARVRLVPDPLTPYNRLRIRRTTTDQLGHFSLTDIAPGKYKLTTRPMASSETATYKAEPQSIALSENEHKTTQVKFEKPQD